MKKDWKKVVTREYTCLWASYTAMAYRIQRKMVGTELRYNLFYGQGDLLTIYRLDEDVLRSYLLIDKLCQKNSKKVELMMDEFDDLVNENYLLFKKIKKTSYKLHLKKQLLELDELFLRTVCYYLFFVFLGYAGDYPYIKIFLKNNKNHFEKIRLYSIDMDMNKQFPVLFGRYDKRLKNYSGYMTRTELLRVVNNKTVNWIKIKKRKKSYLFKMTPKKIVEVPFDKINTIVSRGLSHLIIKDKNKITGQTACSGKEKGRVRVIKTEKDYLKIKSGDVIITPMTKPSIVPFLSKAVAIVTNDGGALCHASIISREMNIPCVVGTIYATDIFKDGDRVEVDANKGVVRKI